MILTSFNNFIQNKTAGWQIYLMQYFRIELNQFTLDAKVANFSRLFITMEI